MGKTLENDIGLYGYNESRLAFGLTKTGYAFFGNNKEVELNKLVNNTRKNYIGGWEL